MSAYLAQSINPSLPTSFTYGIYEIPNHYSQFKLESN